MHCIKKEEGTVIKIIAATLISFLITSLIILSVIFLLGTTPYQNPDITWQEVINVILASGLTVSAFFTSLFIK